MTEFLGDSKIRVSDLTPLKIMFKSAMLLEFEEESARMSNIISEFYGMQIMMPRFKSDIPYFEVYYDGMTHKFSIFPCRMITREKLSPTAQETVQDWARIHKRELEENWNCIQTEKPFKKIPPIE